MPFQKLRQASLPGGFPLTHFQLSNGLTVYVVENHSAPVFHMQTWFRVGSRDEKLDPSLRRTGLAHLFEHMMFRGTKTRKDGEFDQIMARNGGRDGNATTWLDRTNYYQSLPSSRLELAFELESDRMGQLALDHDLLETERSAVLAEYKMGLDDPTLVAYERLYATAFEVHPYRYSTIGTEAEIQGFTIDEANSFYHRYYAPDNATLVLVGDIDPEAAIRLADKHYGRYAPQGVAKLAAPAEPVQTQARRAEFSHPQLSDPKLLIAHHTPGATHADQPALWVFDSVLTTGMGSRLQRGWVDAGLSVSADGSLDQFQDPGLHTLSADLQPDSTPEQALAALDAEVAAFLATSAAQAQEEIERARNQLLLMLYRSFSDNDGIASFMGEYITSAGDPLFAFEQLRSLDQVGVEDVKRVVRQYFTPGNRTVVVGLPEDSNEEDTEEDKEEVSGE